MAKTILLTGAAGFIGANTAQLLLDQGHQVVGIDNINDYYDVALKDYRLKQLLSFSTFKFHEIDIEDKSRLSSIFKEHDFDAVINLAARAGVRASIDTPELYITTNILGSIFLLELCQQYNINKYVLASSSSVYAGHEGQFEESLSVSQPLSVYAASKLSAEHMAYVYHHLYDLDVSVLRYFTVYGPACRPDMSILRFIKLIDEGRPITLTGDGCQQRDFTYVDDIARGTVEALASVGYEVFNLGGGRQPYTINQLIATIEKYLGKKAVIDAAPFHKADMRSTEANIDKAKKVLGWEPTVDLDEGIHMTVEWYKNNVSWLRSLVL